MEKNESLTLAKLSAHIETNALDSFETFFPFLHIFAVRQFTSFNEAILA